MKLPDSLVSTNDLFSGTGIDQITLDFNGVDIGISSSDYGFSYEQFVDLAKNVTGLAVRANPTHTTQGRLAYVPSDNIEVTYSDAERELLVKGPITRFGGAVAMTYAAQYMAECIRAVTTGTMLTHGAAVASPDEAYSYVLLGEKGSGKTTMALRLCHQFGFGLIGNDQIFLGHDVGGNIATSGGSDKFTVRETAITTDPYLSDLVSIDHQSSKPSWNNKIDIDPQSLGIQIVTKTLTAKELFHIRIDGTQRGLITKQWTGLQRNLVLHEKIGRHISGQATPFLDDNGEYLGSLPPIELSRTQAARDKLVALIISKGIVEIFAPDSDTAVDYIQARR